MVRKDLTKTWKLLGDSRPWYKTSCGSANEPSTAITTNRMAVPIGANNASIPFYLISRSENEKSGETGY